MNVRPHRCRAFICMDAVKQLKMENKLWKMRERGGHVKRTLGFGGFDNCSEQFNQFFGGWLEFVIAGFGDEFGLVEQLDPVVRFVCFFQCYRHFVDEIWSALGMFGFADERSNRCTTAQYLFGQDKLALFIL